MPQKRAESASLPRERFFPACCGVNAVLGFPLFSVEGELARSTKFQAPSSKEAPSPQIPNPLLHPRALPNPGVPTAPEGVLARPVRDVVGSA